MPIIKPEIQKVLRTAGLLNEQSSEDLSVEESLTQAGLDTASIASELSDLALRSNNEALRLRAIETALKIKGALKEQTPVIPSFTIIIQGSTTDLSKTNGINPVLFPRQSLKEDKIN